MSYTTMNAKFNGLDDTVANKSVVVGKSDEDLSYNVISGYVGPMAATTVYPVLDKSGNPIFLPKDTIVENVTIKKFDTIGLSAGAAIQLALGSRNTSGVYTSNTPLGASKAFGDVISPVTGTTINYMGTNPILVDTYNYLVMSCGTATTAATVNNVTGSGAIRVLVKVIY